jgi:hypothetical protein
MEETKTTSKHAAHSVVDQHSVRIEQKRNHVFYFFFFFFFFFFFPIRMKIQKKPTRTFLQEPIGRGNVRVHDAIAARPVGHVLQILQGKQKRQRIKKKKARHNHLPLQEQPARLRDSDTRPHRQDRCSKDLRDSFQNPNQTPGEHPTTKRQNLFCCNHNVRSQSFFAPCFLTISYTLKLPPTVLNSVQNRVACVRRIRVS